MVICNHKEFRYVISSQPKLCCNRSLLNFNVLHELSSHLSLYFVGEVCKFADIDIMICILEMMSLDFSILI